MRHNCAAHRVIEILEMGTGAARHHGACAGVDSDPGFGPRLGQRRLRQGCGVSACGRACRARPYRARGSDRPWRRAVGRAYAPHHVCAHARERARGFVYIGMGDPDGLARNQMLWVCRRGCGTVVWHIEDHIKNVCPKFEPIVGSNA